MMEEGPVDEVIALVRRRDWSRLVAGIGRVTGDLSAAEDCVQDAFEAAWAHWNRHGVPDQPTAWIRTTARNRALDRLRREKKMVWQESVDDAPAPVDSDRDALALLFTCAHPALSLESQVALTLRWGVGLDVSAVAKAFLVTEDTMTRRLTRAKTKIRESAIPLAVPDHELWSTRLDSVLGVVYLVFNRGNDAEPRETDRLVLVPEALDLAERLTQFLPNEAEVWGLLALMRFTHARRPARFAPDGSLITLDRQDRRLWTPSDLSEGKRALTEALSRGQPGPYALQAAIAACHAAAKRADDTDWEQIAAWYRRLDALWPTPVVRLNLAVAEGYARGPAAALERLETLLTEGTLDDYPYFHAARAEFLKKAGRMTEALESWNRAIEGAPSDADRRELERRRDL